jgi:hypothetical protein
MQAVRLATEYRTSSSRGRPIAGSAPVSPLRSALKNSRQSGSDGTSDSGDERRPNYARRVTFHGENLRGHVDQDMALAKEFRSSLPVRRPRVLKRNTGSAVSVVDKARQPEDRDDSTRVSARGQKTADRSRPTLTTSVSAPARMTVRSKPVYPAAYQAITPPESEQEDLIVFSPVLPPVMLPEPVHVRQTQEETRLGTQSPRRTSSPASITSDHPEWEQASAYPFPKVDVAAHVDSIIMRPSKGGKGKEKAYPVLLEDPPEPITYHPAEPRRKGANPPGPQYQAYLHMIDKSPNAGEDLAALIDIFVASRPITEDVRSPLKSTKATARPISRRKRVPELEDDDIVYQDTATKPCKNCATGATPPRQKRYASADWKQMFPSAEAMNQETADAKAMALAGRIAREYWEEHPLLNTTWVETPDVQEMLMNMFYVPPAGSVPDRERLVALGIVSA